MRVETKEVRGRRLTGEELRRHLMALILAAVLVWYTSVTPPTGFTRSAPSRPHGDEGRKGGAQAEPPAEGGGSDSVEELDWPEFICVD